MRGNGPILAIVAAGLAAVSGTAQAAGCGDVFKFEPGARLGVADIARLGEVTSVDGPDERAITIWMFHPADRPVMGRWRGLMLMAGTSGTGGPVLGGVLWTSASSSFDVAPASLRRTAGGVKLVVAPKVPMAACPEGFVAFLSDDGTLTAGGVKQGSLRW